MFLLSYLTKGWYKSPVLSTKVNRITPKRNEFMYEKTTLCLLFT